MPVNERETQPGGQHATRTSEERAAGGTSAGAAEQRLIASDWRVEQDLRLDTRTRAAGSAAPREPLGAGLLLDRGTLWKGAGASVAVHALFLAGVAGASLLTIQEVRAPEPIEMSIMEAPSAPVPEPPRTFDEPPPAPEPPRRVEPPKPEDLPPPTPPPAQPAEPAPQPAPEIPMQASLALPLPKPVPEKPKTPFDPETVPEIRKAADRRVRTNTFTGTDTGLPETKLPSRQVQTGGFTPTEAVPGLAEPRPGAPEAPSKVGSFDLPEGPEQGNGAGGATGARGVIANAGFGEVSDGAPLRTHDPGPRATAPAGFGDARPSAPAPAQRAAAPVPPPGKPIEILFKPRPEYTAAARALKLEGDVVLDLLFPAEGPVQVVRLVSGLGHGLDESATAAARAIRFKPAQREGRPVDSTVRVHMVFRLAW